MGLGGLKTDDVLNLKLTKRFWEDQHPEQLWNSSDPNVISELLDYFGKLQGEPLPFNYYELQEELLASNDKNIYLLELCFEFKNGHSIHITIDFFNDYHIGLTHLGKELASYKINNSKTEKEWEEILARCNKFY